MSGGTGYFNAFDNFGTGGFAPAAAGGGGGAAALFQIDFSGEGDADPFVPANYGCTEDTTSGGDGNISAGRWQANSSGDTQSFHADVAELDLNGVTSFYAEIGNYKTAETATSAGAAIALIADAYNPGNWRAGNTYGTLDGYYVDIGASSSHMMVFLYRVVAGVGTFLAQYVPGAGYPNSAGTDIRAAITIQAGQTDIVISFNGTPVLTYNDTNAARIQNFRTAGFALAYSVGTNSLASVTVDI